MMMPRRMLLLALAAAPLVLAAGGAHANAASIAECLRTAQTDAERQACRWKSRKHDDDT